MNYKFNNYSITDDGGNGCRFLVFDHPRIKTIFIFANSMLAVCDHAGQQIPDMQGALIEALEALEEKRTTEKDNEEV